MASLIKFEKIEKFLKTFGLTMYDVDGKCVSAVKEDRRFTPHVYCRRLWLYEEKTDKFTPASLKVENSSFIVTQFKGYGPTSHKKYYDLSERWQKFMLSEDGKAYAFSLIREARETKEKITSLFIKYESFQNKPNMDGRKQLATKLANESKKELIALDYLREYNNQNQGE